MKSFPDEPVNEVSLYMMKNINPSAEKAIHSSAASCDRDFVKLLNFEFICIAVMNKGIQC